MTLRKCALHGCDELLGAGYRRHARYCSAACRAEASRRRRSLDSPQKRTEAHTEQEGEPTGQSEASRKRRSTRDGKGTKLYLLPHDLTELEGGPPYSPRVAQKLAQARERLSDAA